LSVSIINGIFALNINAMDEFNDIKSKNLIPKFGGRTFGDITYNLKNSFKSIKTFFYQIWWFRGSDYTSTQEVLLVCLREHLKALQRGGLKEVDETRLPKEVRLKRAIYLLERQLEDSYADKCGYDYDYDINWDEVVEGEDGYKENTPLYAMNSTASETQKENNSKAMKSGDEMQKDEWEEIMTIMKEDLYGWWC